MLLRFLTTILALPLFLGACRPQEPATDPLPTDLLVTPWPDSLITLADQRDFSGIVPTGQGPRGSLIRWDIKSSAYVGHSSRSFATFTCDQKSRLVGTFDYNAGYGQQEVRQAYYEGDFLAFIQVGFLKSPPWDVPRSQSYLQSLTTELTTVQSAKLIKCQYNVEKQLKQVLTYQRIPDTKTFRLERLVQLEYNAMGQLKSTQTTYRPGPGPVAVLNYWQNGDIIREEIIYPTNPVVTTIYTYNQELNPFARLSLAPDVPQSQHNRATITHMINNNQETEQIVFSRRVDVWGQLISQTVGDENGSGYWLGYTFSYAPWNN